MKFSIIIPVYNQENCLQKSVAAIYKQTLAREDYEVIVINDGSTDNSFHILSALQKTYPFRLLTQANAGAAVTRNRGIDEACYDLILFIQDDIIANPGLIESHLAIHQLHPEETTAVVGYTTWHPELKVTPFMYWLEHGGPQFDYDRIKNKLVVDHLAFYTSNLSLHKSFILREGVLDPDFSLPGITAYEDTEWGFRLMKRGLNLFYQPEAKAFHYHPRTIEEICRRRYQEGKMSHLLYQKHPDLRMTGLTDGLWHQLTHLKTGFLSDHLRFTLSNLFFNQYTIGPFIKLAKFCEERISIPIIFKIVCGYYYNLGYKTVR